MEYANLTEAYNISEEGEEMSQNEMPQGEMSPEQGMGAAMIWVQRWGVVMK